MVREFRLKLPHVGLREQKLHGLVNNTCLWKWLQGQVHYNLSQVCPFLTLVSRDSQTRNPKLPSAWLRDRQFSSETEAYQKEHTL